MKNPILEIKLVYYEYIGEKLHLNNLLDSRKVHKKTKKWNFIEKCLGMRNSDDFAIYLDRIFMDISTFLYKILK